jgi:hypothetical protein
MIEKDSTDFKSDSNGIPTDEAEAHIQAGLEAGRDCLAAALSYLKLGWPVLGLCPPDHIGIPRDHRGCKHPGKRPLPYGGEWKEFQDRLPTEREVRDWWATYPTMNLGMALGNLSRLIGPDADGPKGMARLQEMSKGDLPPTLEFTTPGGGRRYLYRIPDGVTFRPTFEALGKKEELRFLAHGSQTVLPPSRHAKGGRYVWVPGHGPGEIEVAPCPPWLVEHMTSPRKQPAKHNTVAAGEVIGEGRRDSTLIHLAGVMRNRGMEETEILAAIEAVNRNRCDPPLDDSQVRKIARSAARYEPDPMAGVHIVLNGTAAHAGGDAPIAVVRSLASVQPRSVDWLWRHWIPRGAITLLDGDPGLGKSTIALDLAARVSRGWLMPPGEDGHEDPAQVLLLGAEDDMENTVRPRLDAVGADVLRVHTFDGISLRGEQRPPVLPDDLVLVEQKIIELGVVLVIIDPFMAFLTGKLDAHRDQDVRRCMHRLKMVAERTRAAFLVIRHLNKLIGGPALYRGGGSIGIIGAVRSALVVGRNPADPSQCVLAPSKCNLARMPRALTYTLETVADVSRIEVSRIEVSRIEWGEETDLKADDILAHQGGQGQPTVGQRCAEAIRDYLGDGTRESKAMEEALARDGFSERAIKSGRKIAGVRARLVGGGAEGRWMVSLPAAPVDPHDGTP